jgi:hypothetical protein
MTTRSWECVFYALLWTAFFALRNLQCKRAMASFPPDKNMGAANLAAVLTALSFLLVPESECNALKKTTSRTNASFETGKNMGAVLTALSFLSAPETSVEGTVPQQT